MPSSPGERTAVCAQLAIRPIGGRPTADWADSDPMTAADAPSHSCGAVATVCRPSAGRVKPGNRRSTRDQSGSSPNSGGSAASDSAVVPARAPSSRSSRSTPSRRTGTTDSQGGAAAER